MNAKLAEFLQRKEKLEQGGGEAKIKQQHEKGKLTARERLELLFDKGTFHEFGLFVKHRCVDFGMDKKEIPAEGVLTGYGKVNGRSVFAFAHDFTVLGGALGEMQGRKINRIQDAALEARVPLIGLNDSGGARIQEGIDTAAYGDIFYRNVQASGVIPQISAIMGPCAGGATYSPALTDFVITVDKTSEMFITGPQVIKAVTGEDVDKETLGGAYTANSVSGVAHLLADNDNECIEQIKKILDFLPSNCNEKPPVYPTKDDAQRYIEELNEIIPENSREPYEIKDVIQHIVDDGEFFEIQPLYAQNMVIGFARMNGQSIGVVANQPMYMAGCLDIAASEKAARFIRTCDAFNVPLICLVDVPGYLPGVNQEHNGIIRRGAKMLYAWSEATVPKITISLRKVYGGATAAMCSREMKADIIMAWPTTEQAVMGAAGAAQIIFKKEIDKSENPAETRARLTEEYQELFNNPYKAASREMIDEIIEPSQTRIKIIAGLELLKNKQQVRIPRKHGNIPL
jgi:acetyl-CoA carboxylase carboxyltransferase component